MQEKLHGRLRSIVLTATFLWALAISAAILSAYGNVVTRGQAVSLALLFSGFAAFLLVSRSEGLAHWLERLHVHLLFPLLEHAFKVIERRIGTRAYWNRLASILQRYGVTVPGKRTREKELDELTKIDDEALRQERCAARLLQATPSPVAKELSVDALLYLDQQRGGAASESLEDLWKKKDPSPGLAALLHASPDFSRYENRFPHRRVDIVWMLQRLGGFNPRRVEIELDRLRELRDLLAGYKEFLQERGIETGRRQPAGPAQILRRLEDEGFLDNPERWDQAVVDLLLRQISLLAAAFDGIPPAERTSFQAVAATVYCLGKNPEWRRRLCIHLAEDPVAVRLVHCYLELYEDLLVEGTQEGREIVSLGRLFRDWKTMVQAREQKLGEGFEKDLGSVRQHLEAGEWPIRLNRPLEDTFLNEVRKHGAEVRRLQKIIERFPHLREALNRALGGLKLSTIERYLETRRINAYLITFMSRLGSLADLLAALTDPQKRALLETLDIELDLDGRPKYNFDKYTSHVRIGVIPRGLAFDDFFQLFQVDFQKVVENRTRVVPDGSFDRNDLESIEVILHRFGLSGRNYYGFVSGLGIEREQALNKIRDLFAPMLGTEEIYALLRYQDEDLDLVEALMKAPMVILAGASLELTDGEQRALERQDDRLKTTLLEACGHRTLSELGTVLWRGGGSVQAKVEVALPVLHPMLADYRNGLEESTARVFVETYFESLAAVASLRAV